jgi:hypothetical protein
VAAAGLRVRVPGGWGILFVGRRGVLDVRAWRGGLAGDLGSSSAAGDARKEEGRGEKGAARWGQPVRGREENGAREELGRARGGERRSGPWGKEPAQEGERSRPGWAGT